MANCSTPSNYFHILRRQMVRDFRKPLILFTPKSLLRHKLCVSKLEDFAEGSSFQRIYEDSDVKDLAKPKDIKRIVMCTGKVYYDLLQERRARKIKDVTIIRVENLYPFPATELAEEVKKYPNSDVVWCQEEAENMGYWQFVDRRIEGVLTDVKHKSGRPVYVGREAAASPATGHLGTHNKQQAALIDAALTLKK